MYGIYLSTVGFLFVVNVAKYIPYMGPMGPNMYETLQVMGYLQHQLVNAGFLNHRITTIEGVKMVQNVLKGSMAIAAVPKSFQGHDINQD